MALIKDFIQTLIQQQNGVFIVFFTGLILGALLIAFLRGQRVKYLMIENQELTMTLRLERQSNEQLDELLDQARYQLADTFSQLSTDALKRNNEQFLQLAEENLKRHQSEAKAELSTREQAIEQLVKPISDALNKTSAQINTIEKERKEIFDEFLKIHDR